MIKRVSPETLRVTIGGRARLRVEGQGRGRLRVGREKRWVWGAFDETFLVEAPPPGKSLAVVLTGLGGRARVDLAGEPAVNLECATVVAHAPKVEVQVALPGIRGLQSHRFRAPRIVPLTRTALESACLETEPNP